MIVFLNTFKNIQKLLVLIFADDLTVIIKNFHRTHRDILLRKLPYRQMLKALKLILNKSEAVIIIKKRIIKKIEC